MEDDRGVLPGGAGGKTENPILAGRGMRAQWRLLIALAVATFCFLCSLRFSYLYLNMAVDNYYISFVVNGLFDDAGECLFLHPLLNKALRMLSECITSADVFLLTGHVFVFLEFFWLTNLLLRERSDLLLAFAVSALFVIASVDLQLFNANFTVQAASFGATGMLTLLYAQRRERARTELIVGLLFFMAGYMWRKQGGLLCVPFFLLGSAVNVLSSGNRPEAAKRVIRVLVPSLLLTGCLVLTETAMNADETHRLAREYNENRVQIGDFPMLPWEAVRDRAEGEVTEAEYEAALIGLLFDTERMNTELFKKVIALGSTTKFPYTPAGAFRALCGMRGMLGYRPIRLLFLPLFLLSLLGLVCMPGWRRAEILLSTLGSVMILLYFTMRGRGLWHVWLSVLFCELYLVVLNLILEEKHFRPWVPRALACVLLLCALYGLRATAPSLEPISPQLALNARKDADLSYYKGLDDDIIYIWNDRVYNEMRVQGKLVTKELLAHYVEENNWHYGQPYFATYLEELGIPNPAQALLERDDVLLISEAPELIFALLEERAGGPIEVEEVGIFEPDGVPIYRISAKQLDSIGRKGMTEGEKA